MAVLEEAIFFASSSPAPILDVRLGYHSLIMCSSECSIKNVFSFDVFQQDLSDGNKPCEDPHQVEFTI